MTYHRTEARTAYIEWAKHCAAARFDLAASGIQGMPLSQLPVRLSDLELSAPGRYGYPPLQERLARHCGVATKNVVSAIGTSMANYLAMSAVLEAGDEVIIEDPAYDPMIEIARYLSTGSPLPVSRALRKFCASALVEATNRGFTPPAHPFFLICQDLERTHDELTHAYDLHLVALKSALFAYVKEELKTRKRQQNVRYFDDFAMPIQEEDPSEAIRSADIFSRLVVGFDVEQFRGYGGNILAVMFPDLVVPNLSDEQVDMLIRIEKSLLYGGDTHFHAVITARPKRDALRRLVAHLRYRIEPVFPRLFRELRFLKHHCESLLPVRGEKVPRSGG